MRSDIDMAGVEAGDHLETSDEDTSLSRSLAELERIEEAQAGKPTCSLCGQRANQLDFYGLCSKVSESHRNVRERGSAR